LRNQLLATVADVDGKRTYLEPTVDQEVAATDARPLEDILDVQLPSNPRAVTVTNYGKTRHRDLYTPRQLLTLGTLSDMVGETVDRVRRDSGGDAEYAAAIGLYLAFVVDKVAQFNSELVLWYTKEDRQTHTFGRQALSMTWDFAEGNVFAGIGGGLDVSIKTVVDSLALLPVDAPPATVALGDAAALTAASPHPILISTDPPYYDNVPFADLSDFFYVWLRHSLRGVSDEFLQTMLVPKADELIAEPARFDGDKRAAKEFFERGMRRFFEAAAQVSDPNFPTTVYYAFKQAEARDGEGTASTGWETMLSGLLAAGFEITGTWPIRTERSGRLRDTGSNALASAVVLACRPRSGESGLATRREFVTALRSELPDALRRLQHGNIAPVDLAQAAIGPGMAIYSRYSKVVEAEGEPMRVRAALGLINEALDELLAEQEADFDQDTRWCVAWFEQNGMNEGPFGVAETLSRAKNTAINGLVHAGVVSSRGGKVRLLDRKELDDGWDPAVDSRLTVWEVTQYLIARHQRGGEQAAAELLRQLGGGLAETARALAYRLFAVCERKGWAQEALAYNALVTAWPEITRLAAHAAPSSGAQEALEL
jgi:putative DNA methylase